MKKELTEEQILGGLFDCESRLNSLIGEFYSYEPTKEVAGQLFDLNDKLLSIMEETADKLELRIGNEFKND